MSLAEDNMRNPIIWLIIVWLALITLLVLKSDTSASVQPVFDNPVTIRVSNPDQPALILDASGASAHGAWISFRIKCYYRSPQDQAKGLQPPCEFGGLEVDPRLPDGQMRGSETARLFYSPTSQSWDRYTTEGCSVWETAHFTRWCGPNGHTLLTATGGISIRPWRNLLLQANDCFVQGACVQDAYHTYITHSLTVGDCDHAVAGRQLVVCNSAADLTILRLVNEGTGGVAVEEVKR